MLLLDEEFSFLSAVPLFVSGFTITPFPGSEGFSGSEGTSGSDGISGVSSGFCSSFSKTITFLSPVTIFPSASLTEYWTIFSPTVKVFKSVKQTKLLVISPSS